MGSAFLLFNFFFNLLSAFIGIYVLNTDRRFLYVCYTSTNKNLWYICSWTWPQMWSTLSRKTCFLFQTSNEMERETKWNTVVTKDISVVLICLPRLCLSVCLSVGLFETVTTVKLWFSTKKWRAVGITFQKSRGEFFKPRLARE